MKEGVRLGDEGGGTFFLKKKKKKKEKEKGGEGWRRYTCGGTP